MSHFADLQSCSIDSLAGLFTHGRGMHGALSVFRFSLSAMVPTGTDDQKTDILFTAGAVTRMATAGPNHRPEPLPSDSPGMASQLLPDGPPSPEGLPPLAGSVGPLHIGPLSPPIAPARILFGWIGRHGCALYPFHQQWETRPGAHFGSTRQGNPYRMIHAQIGQPPPGATKLACIPPRMLNVTFATSRLEHHAYD